jgi:N-acetylmuramoyl-L-alanine amidase
MTCARASVAALRSLAIDDSRLPPVPNTTAVADHRRCRSRRRQRMTGPIGRGPKIYEKDITLSVANKLGGQLKRAVSTSSTRDRGTLIALDDRPHRESREGRSVHLDSRERGESQLEDPASLRFETYFLSEAKPRMRRVEQMENAVVRLESSAKVDRDDPLSFIKTDMTQNQHLRESSQLAELIQQRLGGMHPGPSRGVKQAGFRVLVTAYMPAVLVEIGFGTNPREAAYMTDPSKQDALARAIADAAMEYLQRYEGRLAGGGPSR